jgi:hypothetical protein
MAQRGDLEASDRVVGRFQGMAVGYAYALLGDFPVAKDAAQEAFIQAYIDLPMLCEPQRPGHVSGLAAYEALAQRLDVNADYPAHNAESLGIRAMVHGDQTMMLDERRNGAHYLRSMVEVAPGGT